MKTGGATASGLDWGDGRYEDTAVELLPATDEALSVAAVEPGEKVLDVGTGTGNAAIAAGRCSAHVLGIDPAPRLIAVARARAANLGLPLEFAVGTSTALPVADASQDLVLSVFAVIFEPNGPAAVAEMVRATKPGGRIVLTAWTTEGAIFRVGRMMRMAVAALASPVGDAPPPANWTDPEAIRDLFAAYPVELVDTPHPLTFHAASPAAWVDTAEAHHPAWRAARRALDDDAWTALRAASIDELAAANENRDAFAVTSLYRVFRADRTG